MTVGQRIAGRIAARGPLRVSEYVEACLYDPDGGFYMRPGGGRAGRRSGDFLTAPEVGPLFGAVLARALDRWWDELGNPDPFVVVDWGAGPATLERAVLAAKPACVSAGALRLVAVELSPAQRSLHPAHPMVSSVASVSEALPEGGVGAGVVLANELLDNLPFDIVQRTEAGWQELRVDIGTGLRGRSDAAAGGALALVAVPAAPELVEGLPDAAAGARVPVQLAARRWVTAARELLGRGRVVVVDYGADTAALAERASLCGDPGAGLGWLRTHRRHDGGTGWLSEPGSCDITTDVALDQVQADHAAEVCTQADFLRRHGIEELAAEGRAVWSQRAHLGDLDALRARSRAGEAHALLDPHGMGGFKVLTWTVC